MSNSQKGTEASGTKFIDLAELITRVREPAKELDEEDDDEDVDAENIDDDDIGNEKTSFHLEIYFISENKLNIYSATTNTEDSHTSISSASKTQRRKPSQTANRWTSSVNGANRRHRRRVIESDADLKRK